VIVDETTPVSTAVALIVTPGIKAPELSLTVPLTVAYNPCPKDGTHRNSIMAARPRNLLMVPPRKNVA
jgi:hypothetical protein